MIDWFARKLGFVRAHQKGGGEKLAARYDAAASTPEMREHWRYADSLSADAAADQATRAILRNRARHERFNNPFMAGCFRTLANDTIGVGPRLQLLTPNETVNAEVERRWDEWAKAVRLGSRLRLARMTRAGDGEIFIRLIKNPRLPNPVKLDLQLIEGDQVETPWGFDGKDKNIIDGIEYDEWNNPITYYVLKRHPGDTGAWAVGPKEFVRIPAVNMIHYYLVERPGQHRGIPEIVSSLNTHGERRSYRKSVLTAARAAAALGAVLLEGDEGSSDEADLLLPFSELPLDHGMMTALPPGRRGVQMKPEQPSTGYGDLSDRLIAEQSRPLNMPYNIAAGDSSRYNYASGRLDHQTYDRSNVVEQDDELVNVVLTRLINAWAIEATSIPGYLPGRAGQIYLPTAKDPLWPVPCEWIWGEREHIDPAKEANAQETRLHTKTTTYAREFARERKDWRLEVEQSGREHEALDEAGLVEVNPQFAPRILETLKSISAIGADAAIELLTVMGVSKSKAKRMVKAAEEAAEEAAEQNQQEDQDDSVVPPLIRDRMAPKVPANGNGKNGVGNAS